MGLARERITFLIDDVTLPVLDRSVEIEKPTSINHRSIKLHTMSRATSDAHEGCSAQQMQFISESHSEIRKEQRALGNSEIALRYVSSSRKNGTVIEYSRKGN